MNLDTRTKAILCIKVRDKMKYYVSDDIGQYFDLVNDEFILNFCNINKDVNINHSSLVILETIFGIFCIDKDKKNKLQIMNATEIKFTEKELLNRIIGLNNIYSMS
jgi:hypothetical protein